MVLTAIFDLFGFRYKVRDLSSVTVSAPVNAKIAPPGYYMIHVLNSAGVPSKAKVIKIPGTSS